jgi:hypothetical protein
VASREPDPVHDLDQSLVTELVAFAAAHFSGAWQRQTKAFRDDLAAMQLGLPWALYQYRIEGETVAEAYLQEQGPRLSRTERAWLAAQQAAWISIWEVIAVDPGVGFSACDLLSGEVRTIREVSASQSISVRDTLLARVVHHEESSFLCGLHPRSLPPMAAAEVERRARGWLRRKRQVPVERLQEGGFGRKLIRRWGEAVAEFDRQAALPPQLVNTDGDPLLLTTDRFEIAAGARPAIAARLTSLEGAEEEEPDGEGAVYTFLRSGNRQHPEWDNTIIGHARFDAAELVVETNSVVRADALRARIEAACGDRLHHRSRSHTDPASVVAQQRAPAPPRPDDPQAEQLELALKEELYAHWPDEPIPALQGKSPREAVRTRAGRAAVDLLLREMEHQEQRAAGGAAFDFSTLRHALGL